MPRTPSAFTSRSLATISDLLLPLVAGSAGTVARGRITHVLDSLDDDLPR